MSDTAYSPADPETLSLKIPPHSIEAEQAVLGGIFLDRDAWIKVVEILSEDDFYRQDHRLIYHAIAALDNAGRPFDLVTVAEWLESHQQLDDAGGLAYLAGIAEKTPSASNIGAYADIVRKRSVLRQLITATGEINETVFNPMGRNSDEILDFAEQSVFEIAEKTARGRRSYTLIKTLLGTALDRVDELYHKQSPITGIATGFDDLDEKTAGLQDSDLIIVAGRPSMGKAQPLDARIRTVDGWRAMGDLKMGDQLASIDGRQSRVAAIYPQGIKDIYRLTFSDGRRTEACHEHLWRVHHAGWPHPRVLSTRQIQQYLSERCYQGRLWIDQCNGEFGHQVVLPLPPRVLGAMLGTGHLAAAPDLCEPLSACSGTAYQRHATGGNAAVSAQHALLERTLWSSGLQDALQALGLWHLAAESLYIPVLYKTAARPARLAMLRGLLGTGGWIESQDGVGFAALSERLVDDVIELVRSVGGWARREPPPAFDPHHGEQRYDRQRGRAGWRAEIQYHQPALLFSAEAKKSRRIVDIKKRTMPVIHSIEFARQAEAQCIAVTHPDKLYLTDDYVVTHNTALAINIAEHAVIKEKKSVAVFSMEMPGEQLAMRMMSSLGRINQQKVRTGKLNDDDWPRLTSAVEILKDARLFIDDTPALTPAELRASCRRIYREHGLDMVIVDYLQLMQVPGTTENRAIEISEISRSLKAMAKELSLPVIALSQLNRSLEQRPNKRPVMSDLRESGAIEQDADVIVFIYRDEVYDEESPDKGLAEIIISKQRNGPIGAVKLAFLSQHTRFENYIPEQPFMRSMNE